MFILLTIIVIIVYTVYKYNIPKRKNCIKPYPGAWPILGHMVLSTGDHKAIWNIMKDVSEFANKEGGATSINLIWYNVCFLTDPDDVMTVVNRCLKKGFPYTIMETWLGHGLITTSGSKWKKGRKLLNPSFNHNNVMKFMNIFNNTSKMLVTRLSKHVNKGSLDMSSDIALCTLEEISLLAMGFDIEKNTVLGRKFIEAIDKILDILVRRVTKIWTQIDFLYRWTSMKKEQDQILRLLQSVTNKMLAERKLLMKQNGVIDEAKYKPIMDTLIQKEELLTEDEIRDHVHTMIASGYETSANTLLFVLRLLADQPEAQEKLFHELNEVFCGSPRDVATEDIPKLVYLDAVLKETLRIYPTAPIFGRLLDSDIKLKNHTLKAGTYAAVSIYGLHRHPTWGPDAHEFRPERFLDGSVPEHPATYIPFSLGKRACIGKTYAMLSIKVALVHVLRHYRFVADAERKLEFKFNIVLKPHSGHEMALTSRIS